jgi:hypothetical protein
VTTITIGDVTGAAEIKVSDTSWAGKSFLESLTAGSAQIVNDLPVRIDAVKFQSQTLGGTFKSPAIALDSERSLTIKAGANCVLTRYTTAESPLLGKDETVPPIPIDKGDYWLSFELDGTFDTTATDKLSSAGFGVSVEGATTVKITAYTPFSGANGLPAFGDALGAALGNFGWLVSATDVRSQKTGTVRVADVSGTVTVSGSYSYPVALNQLSLAEAIVPFQIDINPAITLKVTGSVALTGDYAVRCWRKSESELVLGVFKKHDTTLTAKLTAGAGLQANAGNTDLIATFFSTVSPGIDLAGCGLAKTDPSYKVMDTALTESISHALAVSVNASCAASAGDEAAVVYSIDLTGDAASTDAAIESALAGDWSAIPRLPNARELRNVAGVSHETKTSVCVNLLGLFNYESVADFLRSSTVLHNAEDDGSVTITDKATATRIEVASIPYLADPDKLRRVLYEATISTLAYTAAHGKIAADRKIDQSLLTYHARTSAGALRKELRLAVALGELSEEQLNAIEFASAKPAHVKIDATQSFTAAQAANLFFANPVAHTPRDLEGLKRLGRETLAALLDPNDEIDQRRIHILRDDVAWGRMEDNHFPEDSPASYTDWYDVTFWAKAIHNTAAPLKTVMEALANIDPGTDISHDVEFNKKRKALAKALGDVTSDTHAGFDKGWPIAIMFALGGGNSTAAMTARWDGKIGVPIAGTPRTLTLKA